MCSQPERVSFPKADCLLVRDRYPNLQLFFSFTEQDQVKLKAIYLRNKIAIMLTSDKIIKLIGAQNFTNICTLCKQVKDTRSRLLLIMGLLTEEKFYNRSMTKDMECQTSLSYMYVRHRQTRSQLEKTSDNSMNKQTSQPKVSPGFDLRFELEDQYMQIPTQYPFLHSNEVLQNEENVKLEVDESVQNGELLQTGVSEVWNEEILQENEDIKDVELLYFVDGDDFNDIREATKLTCVQRLKTVLTDICKDFNRKYSPEVVSEQLTSILHDALTMHNKSKQLAMECVTVLVKYGADLLLKINGSTALHIIAKISTADVADLAINCIIESADHLISSKYGMESIVDCIGSSFDDQGHNPVMVAALSCNHEVLEVFLEAFPQIVDVMADGSSESALTLVTIQAIESQLKNDTFEQYKKVMLVLGKYNANKRLAVSRVNSSYVKDITQLKNFVKFQVLYKSDVICNEQNLKIGITPSGRVIRNYIINTKKPLVNHPNIISIENNSTANADSKDQQSVTEQKAITNEKTMKPVTVTRTILPNKRDEQPSCYQKFTENSEKRTGLPRISIKKCELETMKIIDIRDPKLIKNVAKWRKNSKKPRETTPVLVKINEKETESKLKVVSMGDIKEGYLQCKEPNKELAIMKDLLAVDSTKNISEYTPKIVKVESNADHIYSAATNTLSTPSTHKVHRESILTTHENSFFAPKIVKTETVDETDGNQNSNTKKFKKVKNMKFNQIIKADGDACATNNMKKKRSFNSDVPDIEEKKSKNTDFAKSVVAAESQIVTRNHEDEIEKPKSFFEDTRELDDLLNESNEDKIIFETSSTESAVEFDEEVTTEISTTKEKGIIKKQ